MTEERWQHLMNDFDAKLTMPEYLEGWHFCGDSDGLLVGPGMAELERCECSEERKLEGVQG